MPSVGALSSTLGRGPNGRKAAQPKTRGREAKQPHAGRRQHADPGASSIFLEEVEVEQSLPTLDFCQMEHGLVKKRDFNAGENPEQFSDNSWNVGSDHKEHQCFMPTRSLGTPVS